MLKRAFMAVGTFLLAVCSGTLTALHAVADFTGRADVLSSTGTADSIWLKLAQRFLESPPWLFPLLTSALVVWWIYFCWKLISTKPESTTPSPSPPAVGGGRGGDGGSGTIYGNNGTVVGGKGGSSGPPGAGSGGNGGMGSIVGDGGTIMGGDGGNAGQWDGRGGRASAPLPMLASLPMELWGAGRGGAGGETSEYSRRIEILLQIRDDYTTAIPDTKRYIDAGVDHISVEWINARLVALGESWRVSRDLNGYILPSLYVTDR